ncbi:O-antigen ligase family protein [Aureibaculum marinum]|uniref:O-antigen ligase family protein n=1 Tax=Aureibaculum marinum TaxID=2487930 RepID=A0A3N4PDE6_9FLAO|nr:O-antigen ligase family protein [Aureibaculum marinum]RPD97513.1 O-antigen ligase family protein [Aureibaculum marinum]
MEKLKKLFLYGLWLFAFFPLIPNKIKGLPVILLFTIALILFLTVKKYKFNVKKVAFYASLYLLYLLSLFFTTNFINIDKPLATRLSIIVFPLIFGLVGSSITEISKHQFQIFLSTYFIVSVVYCGLIVIYFYQLGFLSENVNINLYYSYLTNEMWYINQHPIYASMFIAIAVLFGLQLLFLVKKWIYKSGIFMGFIVLFAMLLFLSRKSVLLALILAVTVYMVYQIKSRKHKKYILFGIIAIGLLILAAPITQNRFKEVFNPKSYNKIENTNSTSIRFGIYKCAIENIMLKPIFGHGVGDVKNKLQSCYAKTSEVLLEDDHNSHNQYLSIWLCCGIVGLILYVGFLLFNFKKALQEKNILFFSLLLFFCILMLFENILERQSGVILFSLIVNFFAFITIQNHKNSFNFDKLN